MRILVRILVLLLWPIIAEGQATTPKSITTGQATPTQNVVITVNGKKVSFLLSPANIPPLAVNIPALPVALSGVTGTFSCNYNTSTVITNPDGTKTITASCSIVTK